MAKRRKAADLTYDDLLNDTLLTIDLAREAGQHTAALKGLGMIGSEMFQAFVEKRETVNIDIKVNSKAELKAMLINDYGEQLAEQIWHRWSNSTPKLIEHDPTNGAETSESEAERGQIDNSAKTAKLALQSIADSKAPKV
jgi:hypothetical protein